MVIFQFGYYDKRANDGRNFRMTIDNRMNFCKKISTLKTANSLTNITIQTILVK